MDYPHPLVTLKADGTLDYSKVYATSASASGTRSRSPTATRTSPGTDEARSALTAILDDGGKQTCAT